MSAQDALRWRCRRGTRELDLMLMRYLENRYRQAPEHEQEAFRNLLELPDPELSGLLFGASSDGGDPVLQETVRNIRSLRPVETP